LGELRQKMSYITRDLLPQEQKKAREAAKDLFTRLESIDLASSDGNYQKAVESYRAAIKDFDAFLQLLPGQSE
jgi:predicted S18 family serine protease